MKNIVTTAIGGTIYALLAFIGSSIDIIFDLATVYALPILIWAALLISLLFLITAILAPNRYTEDEQ
jgi:predicted membrane protein